jgi:hypothetical protein
MLRRKTGNTKMAENVINFSKDAMKGHFLEVSKRPECEEKPQFCKRGVVLCMDKTIIIIIIIFIY